MPRHTEYAERADGAFTALQRRLLRDKGGQLQHQLLDAAKSASSFVEFMDQEAKAKEGARLRTLDYPLTEQSFKEMTADQEETAFSLWESVPPRVACRTSFWAEVTLQHIQAGVIQEPYWLAANGGRNESGEERIDKALHAEGEAGAKLADDCVRTILRRMGGLPARGSRSVFVNPSFGRAWWRERLVSRITAHDGSESRRALSNAVRSSQEYWERLVMMIVSRGSVLGSVTVQDAFVNALAKHLRVWPDSPLKSASALTPALRRLSNVAAARELGVLEFEALGEISDTLLARVAEIGVASQD